MHISSCNNTARVGKLDDQIQQVLFQQCDMALSKMMVRFVRVNLRTCYKILLKFLESSFLSRTADVDNQVQT
jgi:hypothetical protein